MKGGIPKIAYVYGERWFCPACFEADGPLPVPYVALFSIAASDEGPVVCAECERLVWAMQ